jgi:hypothetical protein
LFDLGSFFAVITILFLAATLLFEAGSSSGCNFLFFDVGGAGTTKSVSYPSVLVGLLLVEGR